MTNTSTECTNNYEHHKNIIGKHDAESFIKGIGIALMLAYAGHIRRKPDKQFEALGVKQGIIEKFISASKHMIRAIAVKHCVSSDDMFREFCLRLYELTPDPVGYAKHTVRNNVLVILENDDKFVSGILIAALSSFFKEKRYNSM